VIDWLPRAACAPDHEPELVQLVASVDDQLSVTGLLTEALLADRAMVTVGAAVGAAVVGAVEAVAAVAVGVVVVLLLPAPPHATRLARSGRSMQAAAQRRLFMGIVRSRRDTRPIGRRSGSLSLSSRTVEKTDRRHPRPTNPDASEPFGALESNLIHGDVLSVRESRAD
jgi:hypothetical protein